jgi:hypothetical protein
MNTTDEPTHTHIITLKKKKKKKKKDNIVAKLMSYHLPPFERGDTLCFK